MYITCCARRAAAAAIGSPSALAPHWARVLPQAPACASSASHPRVAKSPGAGHLASVARGAGPRPAQGQPAPTCAVCRQSTAWSYLVQSCSATVKSKLSARSANWRQPRGTHPDANIRMPPILALDTHDKAARRVKRCFHRLARHIIGA